MFKNYLKVALRNLWKNKTYSILNIAGLAIGLACFLLISVFVIDELSYDRFPKRSGDIYRINSDIKFGGNALYMPMTSDIMGAMLKKDYPEVEQFTRVFTNNGSKLIRKGADWVNENNVGHADSTFFELFTLPALAGDTRHALDEPNTVVLTESAARKYFGTTEVLGKSVEVNGEPNPFYKITAVVSDFPENAHMNLTMFFSMKNVDYTWGQATSHNFRTYLLLRPGADYKALEGKFTEYVDRYVLPQAQQFMNVRSMAEFEKGGNKLKYTLQPLTQIHLHPASYEMRAPGNIQYVYIFSAVALFILLIACINFMNLTTARSANRAREVGIRKVLGTERRTLIAQFLTESTLMVFVSLLLALLIAFLVMPLFNDISGKQISLSSLFSPLILPLLLFLPFGVGLLAGSYPAFYLSGFRPIEVLKGKLRLGSRSGGFRSVLVVFQFATSIILIIGTVIIYRQLHHIQNTNLGFNKEQVLVVDGVNVLENSSPVFRDEVKKMPGVLNGTISAFLPVENSSHNDNSYSRSAVADVKDAFDAQSWTVDYDYLNTLGMQLIKGRNFSPSFGTDSTAIIINETLAKVLGFADPMGQKIYALGNRSSQAYTIIGVVKDFHFENLRQKVQPLAFFLGNSSGSAAFKVKAENLATLLPAVEAKWKTMAPGLPFQYRFLDESFNEMYRAEQRVGTIALVFAVLAIFIACLGLFGLATYIAEQRTKEIGIRKVLGASTQGLVQLLSKDFLRLVLISFVIAAPVAGWAMHRWLQDYTNRVSLSWWIFALAGSVALLIALATVSFQAVKAALSNPVKNLRTE